MVKRKLCRNEVKMGKKIGWFHIKIMIFKDWYPTHPPPPPKKDKSFKKEKKTSVLSECPKKEF